MERNLKTALFELNALSAKRKQLTARIQHLEQSAKKLKTTLHNPIFGLLLDALGLETLASITLDYLNLEYCIMHKTLFPSNLLHCLGWECCNEVGRRSHIIYTFANAIDLMNNLHACCFHEDDADFKHHFLQMVPNAKLTCYFKDSDLGTGFYFVHTHDDKFEVWNTMNGSYDENAKHFDVVQ
jgi:hypothetical protein